MSLSVVNGMEQRSIIWPMSYSHFLTVSLGKFAIKQTNAATNDTSFQKPDTYNFWLKLTCFAYAN